jgi:hypothetical protein
MLTAIQPADGLDPRCFFFRNSLLVILSVQLRRDRRQRTEQPVRVIVDTRRKKQRRTG